MTIVHSIIFGIVEGITEFLPISSTAHLDITRALVAIPITDFFKSFEIVIQLGAIAAVGILYAKPILTSWKTFRNIVIAFIPTGIIGFLLYKIIKSIFLSNLLIEAIALAVGGALMIYYETRLRKDIDVTDKSVAEMTPRQLLTLGVVQALAVIPGVSRSGAVIIGGRIMHLPRKLITEFSFMLAIPTMLAASGYDLLKSGFAFDGKEWGLIGVGFVVSFIIALFVVRWLLAYIKEHDFKFFGWYRVILGVLMFVVLFF